MEKEGFKVKVVKTLKLKVVNESMNKKDKSDAKTIAEFLSKDMLPEVKLSSKHLIEDSKDDIEFYFDTDDSDSELPKGIL
jgi:hypothetical protein